MLSRLSKWNTLRNQLLAVYLFVMVIVLLIVGVLTLNQVSTLIQNNAKQQIQQVALESSGRFESLYEQINMNSKLVITNNDVQNLLTMANEGKQVSFGEMQRLMRIVNTIQANTDGIFSFEIYTKKENRIIPLEDASLRTRINNKWIKLADEAKGELVWIGKDPKDSNYFLAIRRMNLMQRSYSNGGYLLIRIYQDYFEFPEKESPNHTNQFSILLDKQLQPIITDFGGNVQSILNKNKSIVHFADKDWLVTKQSSTITGWTVVILSPVSALTKGITVIRTGIVVSGVIGFVIFFVCSLFLSTVITKPIVNLTETMQRASKGSLTMNPEIFSTKEIKELNSTYNKLVKETNHLIKMVYEKELIRSRSELKALQAQINPHFLFNTLDALYWSLMEKNEEKLSELVLAMSDLFRYTITKHTDDEWVFIKDEIKHIEDYLEIMKMRFGDRLNWQVSLPKEWENVKIPKLLIQPLVENAVLHGAGNKIGECTISVSIQLAQDPKYLQVIVEDDGSGIDQDKLKSIIDSMEKGGLISDNGEGMAISNVNKRLQLFYQEKWRKGLTIKSKLHKGTYISFEIPIDRGESGCMKKQF